MFFPFPFCHKVFESVEAESTAEGEETLQSSLVKTTDGPRFFPCESSSPDVSNQHEGLDNPPKTESTAEPTASQQTDNTPNDETTTGSESGKSHLTLCESAEKDGKQSVVEEEGVMKKMETNLESEEVAKTQNKSKETFAAENKETTHVEAVDTNMNVKSALENTNVLKLETEIHNEYFQAPPLGQTLSFQTNKSRDVEGETHRLLESRESNLQSKKTENAETAVCDFAETKKAAEIEKPGSNSPVRQVLNALQSASRGSLSLSHSQPSPDTADSDDSPSALEMEDIPAGITCVTSEDIRARPLVGLAAPPIPLAQREKMASESFVQDQHLDTACNTSPEVTDLGLSEEEPEMDNVLAEQESTDIGCVKYEESSEEQTYSVSIIHNQEYKGILFIIHTDRCLDFSSKKRWTCT